MEECVELRVASVEAVTQGCFVDGKLWGFSDLVLRITDLSAFPRCVLTTLKSFVNNHRAFCKIKIPNIHVPVADNCLWLKVTTKKPSVKWKQILIPVWASAGEHFSTRARTPRANVAWFLGPHRKVPRRSWGRRHYVQPSLNSGKCHWAWCSTALVSSKASHPYTAPVSPRTSWADEWPWHDFVLAWKGCKKFSLILHPTWLPYGCESPNKPLLDTQLNLCLCIQYLAAHPVLLVLANTIQHIINHERKKLCGLAWFSLL